MAPSAAGIFSASAATESMWRMNNAQVLSYIVGSVDPTLLYQFELSAQLPWFGLTSKQASNLWKEIDMLSASMLSTTTNFEIQAERQCAHAFQFLMRLRLEF
ncbi:hypothetical protein LINPERPRIM_LOCUS6704 [Linum perenne]